MMFLFLAWAPEFVLAQNLSELGRFSVDFVRGCVPLTVEVTELDAFGMITRQYFYENETDVTTATTHTYNAPGRYALVQLVGVDVEQKTDTLWIEVLPSTQPSVLLEYCENQEVSLTITDELYDHYLVRFGEGSATSAVSGDQLQYQYLPEESPTFTIQGQVTGGPGNCAVREGRIEELFVQYPQPRLDSVEWVRSCEKLWHLIPYGSFDPLLQYEWRGPSGRIWYKGRVQNGRVIYSSSDLTEEDRKQLDVSVINVCNGERVQTQDIGADKIRILEPLMPVFSSYVGNNIQLRMGNFDFGEYVIERSRRGEVFSERERSQENVYLDEDLFLPQTYEYRISYLDSCGNQWGHTVTRPPFIKIAGKEGRDYLLEVRGAQAQPQVSGAMILTVSGDSVAALGDGINVYSPRGSDGKRQRWIAEQDYFGSTLLSNAVDIQFELEVFVPKAFTPNGDGLNDRLQVFGLQGSQALLHIYNRWGQLLYAERSGNPAWDGSLRGEPAEPGVYLYEISLTEIPGQVQRGTFVLLEN
jgi:gliding motility-associated-like protein